MHACGRPPITVPNPDEPVLYGVVADAAAPPEQMDGLNNLIQNKSTARMKLKYA